MNTFKYRQSSLIFGGPAKTPNSVTCAQVFANFVARSGSCQRSTGCGGIQRRFPTGGLAKGSGLGMIYKTATTNNEVCVVTSAAVQLSGSFTYTQF